MKQSTLTQQLLNQGSVYACDNVSRLVLAYKLVDLVDHLVVGPLHLAIDQVAREGADDDGEAEHEDDD